MTLSLWIVETQSANHVLKVCGDENYSLCSSRSLNLIKKIALDLVGKVLTPSSRCLHKKFAEDHIPRSLAEMPASNLRVFTSYVSGFCLHNRLCVSSLVLCEVAEGEEMRSTTRSLGLGVILVSCTMIHGVGTNRLVEGSILKG